ncbi:MAG: hypothetical protein HY904_24595 [Deltaproteobacteria bacterium]|nr:hypothetical protein [Deltaproteobacteria bacterium]
MDRKKRGFLLIEAAVAGAVLAAVLASLVFGLTQAKQQQQGAVNRMAAMYAAQDKMEALHNVAYASLTNESSTAVPGSPGYFTVVTVTAQNFTDLSIAYSVKQVEVAVNYPGGQVKLTTLRSP